MNWKRSNLYFLNLSTPIASNQRIVSVKCGAVERKFFSKERGRGDSIARIRIAYQNESVREFVDRYSRK